MDGGRGSPAGRLPQILAADWRTPQSGGRSDGALAGEGAERWDGAARAMRFVARA